ncbi:alpha/beta fold hydrolase [Thermochromatium tepidum]|uniref:Alpha/beta hydrolase n=1 Tax=Thermochromatium tepidum ATCC 43061 TaxID=316276 RepID=A0A6I6EBQ6_THETI|nr:alpha/beta hydrolase [Thermochromatium tepidum]QGU32756.1 alpha/beta hydrolase [Thermochromatium tepidum ATCC 43061]
MNPPEDPTERIARVLGFEQRLVEGAGFQHRVWMRGNPVLARRVHVYLEGDGTPWLDRRRVAADPSPRRPLMPRLMARDPTPSLLVGRPCYHGLAHSPGCLPWHWTHGRYGEPVVFSLARAIERVLPPRDDRELVLIGHSGGGTLAVLLAPRLKGVTTVVTLAANLDVSAWAKQHSYSPLSGSLDPCELPPLDPSIRQIHLLGEQDAEVPPWTLARYRMRNPQARFEVVAGVDHGRGWVERWPALLDSAGSVDVCQARRCP